MNVDFSLVLVILVLITGVIWGIDHLLFEKRRLVRAQEQGKEAREPVLVEYARFLFPVVVIVFLLRGFIAEPFRIPSGSMLPTLEVGDFILVSKSSYGIRIPVLNKKLIDFSSPERGDVIVFRYPEDPSVDYIKRVVGIPGDKITYQNKTLYINGDPQPQLQLGNYQVDRYGQFARLQETLNGKSHDILVNTRIAATDSEYVIPEGHYFAMGDNRDNSRDSRAWGFVPDENLVGRAFFIWMNWNSDNGPSWSRIGTIIR